MYSEDDLVSAIRAGVITEEAAAAFRRHVAQSRQAPAVDEEYVRLLTGFNDVFVVIACLLLLLAVYRIVGSPVPAYGLLAVALVAWGLAEQFTRRRRMALPSIVLLLAFVGGVLMASLELTNIPVAAFLLAAAAAWAHWLRFHVPITVAAGVAALVGALAIAIPKPGSAPGVNHLVLLVSGVIVFLLAMHWDASDIRRQTRRSDVSFWLHLLAAPLLVHPVFSMLGLFEGRTELVQALSVIALYVAVSVVSLAVDRRALMVSSLAYVLYSFSALLERFGVVSMSFAFTALVIGAALLLLSVFWQASRAGVLRYCPAAVMKRLPPPQ